MRPLREVIDAAKAGKRLRPGEVKMLGEQLHLYWVLQCVRCRRRWPVDSLDERDRCEECVEAVARMGE